MEFKQSMQCRFNQTVCLCLLGLASVTGAATAQTTVAPTFSGNAAGTRPVLASPLAELKQRLTEATVRELRTSYSGEYGTTLLLADDAPIFYVALLHKKNLWRVLRFDAIAPAEQAYTRLAQRSADWASDAMRLQVLTSQERALARAKEESEARLATLNADMQIMQGEQARILQAREVAQSQAQASDIERKARALQLQQLQRDIRQLEQALSGVNAQEHVLSGNER